MVGDVEVDGERLRRLRRERALSQQGLKRIAGVAQSTISELESGKRSAKLRTVRILAEALGVEPKELMKQTRARSSQASRRGTAAEG
ncbi:transcriptional regulator, XRE family [Rubrobacter xylanophilus DSM 9941]|uniref:Transcriptional regulator, XRE family n=1 Tax=Rubrobacter xylanophilus (strain DSM 9941 / JCM 11954 / NBRC 16129 / PRD-1) TaxID=266117 RepID=Q1ATV6_RUBXD|nr:transcriptional regulator, XRE family [Rubrobacter xylanophilus DSM 9941]